MVEKFIKSSLVEVKLEAPYGLALRPYAVALRTKSAKGIHTYTQIGRHSKSWDALVTAQSIAGIKQEKYTLYNHTQTYICT